MELIIQNVLQKIITRTAQAGEVVIHNIAFNSIKTRYVKAVFTAYMKEWGLWCYEFEVYKR